MQILIMNGKGGSGKSTLTAALAQVMDADIIDHDNQGTLTLTSAMTGINKPITAEGASKQVIIHDTPPYNTKSFKSQVKHATAILIPCRVSYADLMAVGPVIGLVRECNASAKTMIVFNCVRKPHNNAYRQIKAAFQKNYQDITKAETELSMLNSFLVVFAKKLEGQALSETKALTKEIKRRLNIT